MSAEKKSLVTETPATTDAITSAAKGGTAWVRASTQADRAPSCPGFPELVEFGHNPDAAVLFQTIQHRDTMLAMEAYIMEIHIIRIHIIQILMMKVHITEMLIMEA